AAGAALVVVIAQVLGERVVGVKLVVLAVHAGAEGDAAVERLRAGIASLNAVKRGNRPRLPQGIAGRTRESVERTTGSIHGVGRLDVQLTVALEINGLDPSSFDSGGDAVGNLPLQTETRLVRTRVLETNIGQDGSRAGVLIHRRAQCTCHRHNLVNRQDR